MYKNQTRKIAVLELAVWTFIAAGLLGLFSSWLRVEAKEDLNPKTRIAQLTAGIELYHKNINQCRDYCGKEPIARKIIPTEIDQLKKTYREHKEHLGICMRICSPGTAPVVSAGDSGEEAFVGAAAGVAVGEIFRQALK